MLERGKEFRFARFLIAAVGVFSVGFVSLEGEDVASNANPDDQRHDAGYYCGCSSILGA